MKRYQSRIRFRKGKIAGDPAERKMQKKSGDSEMRGKFESYKALEKTTAGNPAERKNMERKIRNIIDATGHIFMKSDPDFR